MSEWPVRSISEIATFLNTKRIPLSARQRDGRKGAYPYYGASGIFDHIDDYIFDGTYLLISEDGENLRARKTPIAFKVSGKFWVNNHAHVLAEREPGILDYLEYAFSALDISPYVTGAVQPKLNKGALEGIKLSIPTRDERLAINATLNSLTDKIELNRRMNETLEAMAQAIFRDWFVDFGPVRRKMEGATGPVKIMGGVVQQADEAARLANLFPAALADNGLPEGWEERPLTYFLSLVGGGTPKTSVEEYWSGTIPWFSIVDTPPVGGVFALKTEKHISDRGLAESSARLVPKGTTIISARGTVGNLAIAPAEMTFNQSCYGLRAIGPAGEYLVYLAAQRAVDLLRSMAHGSVFSTITRQTFDGIALADAGQLILQAFESLIDPLFEKILGTGRESETLAAMRDLLLPKLMSGEIRLKDAEKMAEAAE